MCINTFKGCITNKSAVFWQDSFNGSKKKNKCKNIHDYLWEVKIFKKIIGISTKFDQGGETEVTGRIKFSSLENA